MDKLEDKITEAKAKWDDWLEVQRTSSGTTSDSARYMANYYEGQFDAFCMCRVLVN